MMDIQGTYQDISDKSRWVGIIGTREPTNAERKVAFKVAEEAVSKGFIVVSGLAKGIDTVAHLGALSAGGKTVAIVNTPANQPIYPKENASLANKIRESGCIIHPFDTPASEVKENGLNQFVRRLLERDVLLAFWCPRIISVSDKEIITGGTKWATNYGMKFGQHVYRCDSSKRYYLNPKVEKCNVWWDMELRIEELIEKMKEISK